MTRKKRHLLKFLMSIIATIIVFGVFLTYFHSSEKKRVMIVTNDGIIEVSVEIADDSVKRTRGLMGRKYLGENSGMFFLFDEERPLGFWMKNTLIPLDMIFISKDFRIVDIKYNVQPCVTEKCSVYTSVEPAKYVLEVNGGFAQKNGIRVNDSVIIND